MKKALPLLLSLVLCLTLCACGAKNTSPVTENSVQSEVPTESVAESTVEPEPEISYEVTSASIDSWEVLSDAYWTAVNIEISNTGTTNLRLLDSFFDLENSTGELVSAQQRLFAFPDIIAPGETGYFNIITHSDHSVGTDLTVVPRILVEATEETPIRYNVSDVEAVWDDEEYGSFAVIGRIENCTSSIETKACVAAFVYDQNNLLIGGFRTAMIENLAPGEKVGFEAIGIQPPLNSLDEISKIICVAYPYREQPQN